MKTPGRFLRTRRIRAITFLGIGLLSSVARAQVGTLEFKN